MLVACPEAVDGNFPSDAFSYDLATDPDLDLVEDEVGDTDPDIVEHEPDIMVDPEVDEPEVTDVLQDPEIEETDPEIIERDPDVDAEPEADEPPVELNECGGTAVLSFKDSIEVPGNPCGVCRDGVLMCHGRDALICYADTDLNVCEGCGPTPGLPTDSCGTCDAEVYSCDEGEMVCSTVDRNVCGGCEELDEVAGSVCDVDDGLGLWHCQAPEDVTCIEAGSNACGGSSTLTVSPGTPCGTCNLGTWVCDGLEGVDCEDSDAGTNSCGGCGPLMGQPGTECGLCGGEWECDGDGQVVCSDTDRNSCGGCEELLGEPDARCGVGRHLVCSGIDSVECASQEVNLCGGVERLEGSPGEACGDCGDGFYVCVSLALVACVRSTPPNACDGCAVLPAAVGASCGAQHRWTCDEGALVCAPDDGSNLCGGDSVLEAQPGHACDDCNSALWACDGADDVDCVGEVILRDVCGVCGGDGPSRRWVDIDDDGLGDPNIDLSIMSCDPVVGYVDNSADDRPDCHKDLPIDECGICNGPGGTRRYDDTDDDGLGDPSLDLSIVSCDSEDGYVDNADDDRPDCHKDLRIDICGV